MSVPIIFFSGINYPVLVLPSWAQEVSSLIPFTYGLRAVRSGFLKGAGIKEMAGDLGVTLFFAGLFFFLGFLLVGFVEQVAKKEGRVSFY